MPVGTKEFPFQSLIVTCPLCDEQRRYLPSEVFLGRSDVLIDKKLNGELQSDRKVPTTPSA